MEYRLRINWLGAVSVLAIAVTVSVITSTVVASRAFLQKGRQQAQAYRDVTVKGSARVRVRSDIASWRISVSGEAPTLDASYEQLERGVEAVHSFLNDAGFTPNEIGIGPIATGTHRVRDARGNTTREIEAYTLSRDFVVRTSNVDAVATAAGRVTELLRTGIRVHSFAPSYTVSQIGDTKIELAGLASANARERAERIAREAGCRVTEVRDATMGVIQITRPDSTDVRSYGIYDTTTIEKDVTVVVTLRIGLLSN